jgi:hypothetical protein
MLLLTKSLLLIKLPEGVSFSISMKKNIYRWIPAILWGILLAFLSLMPGRQGDFFLFGIPHIDKFAHFGMYAVWAFFVYYAWHGNSTLSRQNIMWLTALTGTIVGILFEFGQDATRMGRNFEIMDMVANGFGALAGSYAGLFQKNKR